MEPNIWYQSEDSGSSVGATAGVTSYDQPASEEAELDEAEPDTTPGAYWLPIFFGRGAGKGRAAHKGKKGGRYSLPKKGSGKRPKGGKSGACHICGSETHWKGECPMRKGKGGLPFSTQKGNHGGGQGAGKGGAKGNANLFGKGKAAFYFSLLGLFCACISEQICKQMVVRASWKRCLLLDSGAMISTIGLSLWFPLTLFLL